MSGWLVPSLVQLPLASTRLELEIIGLRLHLETAKTLFHKLRCMSIGISMQVHRFQCRVAVKLARWWLQDPSRCGPACLHLETRRAQLTMSKLGTCRHQLNHHNTWHWREPKWPKWWTRWPRTSSWDTPPSWLNDLGFAPFRWTKALQITTQARNLVNQDASMPSWRSAANRPKGTPYPDQQAINNNMQFLRGSKNHRYTPIYHLYIYIYIHTYNYYCCRCHNVDTHDRSRNTWTATMT